MAYYFSIDGKNWKDYQSKVLNQEGYDGYGMGRPLGAPLYDYSFGQIRDAAQALGIKNINRPLEVQDILNQVRNPRAAQAAQATQAQTETSPQDPVTPSPTVPDTGENVPGSPSTYVPGQGVIDSTDAQGGQDSQGGQQTLINGMTPAEFDLQAELDKINAAGNIQTTISDMRTSADRYIADVTSAASIKVGEIGAGATKYAADRSLEASNYASDRNLEAILGAENIRKDTALQLQPIINAGLKEVETIRGASAEEVARIAGEFGVKGEEVRGKAARDVAKIDKDKAIYGSLISAFSFT